MRTTPDRIRHAISFEIIGLITSTPLGALVFDKPILDIGVVALVGASVATVWNYLFNLGFDHALARRTGSTQKTIGLRVLHAIGFEAGLLALLLPFVAWYLDVSLWQALTMDIAFALYYVVYAFIFNWAYDRLFPLPEWQAAPH
ncbi:membrane protein [Devosia pacifica]|uniref:Membrane protein n=1 Tax=Devosia pacifica TaxID=1335967 RepID=A0A918S6Z3_9HYPH|nr:PACE efflux transporter [Devosia pacifica]GHA25911.1 membrane protein [Devosia pacifica]